MHPHYRWSTGIEVPSLPLSHPSPQNHAASIASNHSTWRCARPRSSWQLTCARRLRLIASHSAMVPVPFSSLLTISYTRSSELPLLPPLSWCTVATPLSYVPLANRHWTSCCPLNLFSAARNTTKCGNVAYIHRLSQYALTRRYTAVYKVSTRRHIICTGDITWHCINWYFRQCAPFWGMLVGVASFFIWHSRSSWVWCEVQLYTWYKVELHITFTNFVNEIDGFNI